MKSKKRKNYTKSFKEGAVKLITDEGILLQRRAEIWE